MAQFTIHGNWRSIAAFASLFTLIGLVVYALASGESLGLWLYLAAIVTIFFGFYSKEDHVAVLGITGLSMIIILDVLLRVGVLSFNACHGTFGALHGC